MSDGVLSQEEIDALLKSDTLAQENGDDGREVSPAPGAVAEMSSDTGDGGLSDMEKDAVGEVANIVMGSAATALSTLLGKKVEITTPVIQLTDPERFRQDYPLPYVLVNVEYITGIEGANVLIIRNQDACVMVDLMMGGDGQGIEELNEMHLSAISEAMNQMMGSASTAMSTIIKERVEITPPTVEEINFATDELKGTLGQKDQQLVKVSFRMAIEELVDSEIMQLIPLPFAREMVGNLMSEINADEPQIAADATDLNSLSDEIAALEGTAAAQDDAATVAEPVRLHEPGSHVFENKKPEEPAGRPSSGANQVPVQPARFAPLQAGYEAKEIANIDLIMDVPLQITVELGKTRKTIREILNLGPGSVVELDKLAGEPVDVLVNGKLLAKGEVVVIDENFGIRVTDIISPIERVTNLQ
ncbi:MAG: flagellar motor switch phosphatase FliY [Firmicutes bacterium HGW-Firmicutes-14]|nr:MAG: flagellar motor switch phosphatase FliY [Firmicutes bacterium HGW-Firmicutes-14]